MHWCNISYQVIAEAWRCRFQILLYVPHLCYPDLGILCISSLTSWIRWCSDSNCRRPFLAAACLHEQFKQFDHIDDQISKSTATKIGFNKMCYTGQAGEQSRDRRTNQQR